MIALACMIVMAAVFAGELWIKNHIEKALTENETRQVWNGRILIRRHHNRGAVLNMGHTRRKLIAVISVIMTVAATIVFVLSLGQKGNNTLRMGLALLLGGAFSNTYDRLKRKYVVDYFSFGVKWKGLRSIIFNLSDFCIMIGALITAIGAGK